jgi:hypothetical protein
MYELVRRVTRAELQLEAVALTKLGHGPLGLVV